MLVFNLCPDCDRPFRVVRGPSLRCFPCRLTRNAGRQAIVNKVAKAIKGGVLTRLPCEVCAAGKADAHHDDYSKPLDVRWLCRSHHQQHHRDERRRLVRRAINNAA